MLKPLQTTGRIEVNQEQCNWPLEKKRVWTYTQTLIPSCSKKMLNKLTFSKSHYALVPHTDLITDCLYNAHLTISCKTLSF